MQVVICYDITSASRLSKVAKKLESYGVRCQYSLFELDIGKSVFKHIMSELTEIIDLEEDSIRAYLFCQNCSTMKFHVGNQGGAFSLPDNKYVVI